MSEPVDQHLVSKGYQKNFADGEKKVALFDTVSGQELRRLKAVRSNFTEEHSTLCCWTMARLISLLRLSTPRWKVRRSRTSGS